MASPSGTGGDAFEFPGTSRLSESALPGREAQDSERARPPADPVVSPADTLRRVFNEIPHGLSLEEEAEGRAALDALLAVGERDKAEIARLTEERDAAVREAGIWQRDRNVQASAGERDRRQIARLNAIEAAARKVYYGPSKGSQAVKAWGELGAVLADEEDAK